MQNLHKAIRWITLSGCFVLGTGCYTLQSASLTAPQPGTVVALDVNDAGRVALGGTIGPEIGQIEGRLVSQEPSEYVLAVSTVRMLRGGEQVWSGERVRIGRDQVGNAYVRRFDKGRTLALGAVVVGAVAAIALSSDLIGFGREPDPPIEPPTGGESLRVPLKALLMLWR